MAVLTVPLLVMGRRRLFRHVAIALAKATAAGAAVANAGWPVPRASPAPTAPLASTSTAVRGGPVDTRGPVKGRCPREAAGALAELGCELAAGLGGLEGSVAVAAAAVVSDPPVSRSAELSTRLAALVAKQIGARPLPGALSLSEARGQGADVKLLVVVSTTLGQGRVRAAAAVFPAALGFWDRLRTSQPPLAEASAVRRMDGELASFLPKVALAPSPAERVAGGVDALALACGAVSGSGATGLVSEGRRKVVLGRVENGHLAVRAEADWATLSPIAPSPLREPIGSVTIQAGHSVDIGLTDRASGVELSPDLAVLGKLDAPMPWESVGCLSRTGVALGVPKPCRRDEVPGMKLDATEIDVFASGVSVDAAGKSERTVAFRNARTREVTVRDGAGRTAQLGAWGGALAVGDVDLDGEPEILTSLPTEDPASDALVVSTWGHDGTVRERTRVSVKDGVRSLAVCPPEDFRMTPIAVGTGTGLWILR